MKECTIFAHFAFGELMSINTRKIIAVINIIVDAAFVYATSFLADFILAHFMFGTPSYTPGISTHKILWAITI